jgi:hypothetical protein
LGADAFAGANLSGIHHPAGISVPALALECGSLLPLWCGGFACGRARPVGWSHPAGEGGGREKAGCCCPFGAASMLADEHGQWVGPTPREKVGGERKGDVAAALVRRLCWRMSAASRLAPPRGRRRGARESGSKLPLWCGGFAGG